MRWIVGDIQGCASEFERLLRDIRFDPARDELWCLGDLVNRGPDSRAVVRLWIDVGGRAILGNHEVHVLLAASGRRPRKPEKLRSVRSLLDAPDAADLLDRLRRLPVMVRLPAVGDGPDVRIVHAGLHPAWSDLDAVAERLNAGPFDDDRLLGEDLDFAVGVRCCTPDGERSDDAGPPSGCAPPFRPWDAYYRGESLVVHGHWATRGFYRGKRTMGLDSGCVYGGALTAWCQDEDRVVQVPAGAA